MKYQVTIPKQKVKHLKGKLTIRQESGWQSYPSQVYELAPDQTSFEFEVADKFTYIYECSILDAPTFNVYVEFSNGESKEEKYFLVPMKI